MQKCLLVCVLTCWMVINFPPSVVMQSPAESGMLTNTCKPSHYLALFHLSLQNKDFFFFFFLPLSSKTHSRLSCPDAFCFTLHGELLEFEANTIVKSPSIDGNCASAVFTTLHCYRLLPFIQRVTETCAAAERQGAQTQISMPALMHSPQSTGFCLKLETLHNQTLIFVY